MYNIKQYFIYVAIKSATTNDKTCYLRLQVRDSLLKTKLSKITLKMEEKTRYNSKN